MAESVDEIKREYEALCHAMQSGVAAVMNYDVQPTTPKHLRVGVNSALVDSGALAKLLMAKGVISELEYYTALRAGMRAEVENYKTYLAARMGGAKIDLR